MKITIPYPVIGIDADGDLYFGINTITLTFWGKDKTNDNGKTTTL